MKISTKGRYALRLMLDIAEYSQNGNVTLKDVAKRQNISIKYLEQIVSPLCKAGFLRSQRGSQGGYKMTRPVNEYIVGDILRVTEGSLAPTDCLEDEVNQCPKAASCPTIKFWKGLYDAVNDYVDNITVADLLSENEANRDGIYYI